MYARTRASADSFVLMRDQIRDWGYALGPVTGLPLTGTQSTAGGYALGPIYYWILWLSRVLVGPWTNNLPHAGAIGISLLQTGADLALLRALQKKSGSFWLALATVLFGATISHDLAISSTIWNPAVSVAFVKLSIALVLLKGDQRSTWWLVVTTVCAWFSVQAHSAALFFAAPVLGFFVVRDLRANQFAAAWQTTRTVLEVILILELPFIVHAMTPSPSPGPNLVGDSVARTLSNPASLRVGPSLSVLLGTTSHLLLTPYAIGWGPWLFALCVIVAAVRMRRDAALLFTTILPLAVAVGGFAVWQRNYDEYWFLPFVPSAAIIVAWALTSIRPREMSLALLVIVLALQPGRLRHSLTWYRMPEYRALSRGAREIRRQTAEVRRIDTSFPLPGLSSATFLYEVLGGRLSPTAAFDATIDREGHAQFVAVK